MSGPNPKTEKPIAAAVLAVGTEVTDGQIADLNSAWISSKLARAGIHVIEHRAVADDRGDIARALRELSLRTELLFVTGGLGPTSDDFTREVLAAEFSLPLEYNKETWNQVSEKLASRGVQAREIQKQQCYFPKSARILANPSGTADGFSFVAAAPGDAKKIVRVYALPGPPIEVAAIWERGLNDEMEGFTPPAKRNVLTLFRCLGRGESDIAELVEEAIRGSHLRVGYRANVPYVEVKLWHRKDMESDAEEPIERVRAAIAPWIVGRDDEDVCDPLIARLRAGGAVAMVDGATDGLLLERITRRLTHVARQEAMARGKDAKSAAERPALYVETAFASQAGGGGGDWARFRATASRSLGVSEDKILYVGLFAESSTNSWTIRAHPPAGRDSELKVQPPYSYTILSDRARRYFVEKLLHYLGTSNAFATISS